MYTIEKNIPVPTLEARQSKYPFADMKIGDSFAVQTKTSPTGSIKIAETKYNAKYTVRKIEGGFRIWRTK